MMPKLATFSAGSTGHRPVPPGDSPGGIASARVPSMDSVPQPGPAHVPFGESPSGAGGSPALPSLIILTTGDAEKNRQFFAEHKLDCPVLLQKGTEIATAYQANGALSGYLIEPEGKIASQLAIGAEALLALAAEPRGSRREEAHSSVSQHSTGNSYLQNQSLLTSAATGDGDRRASRFTSRSLARSKIKRDGLKAGTLAPVFQLPRLDGHGDLSLGDLRGRRVLLVFSSPHCGPCNTLAPELEKFHRKQSGTERPLTLTLSPSEGERKSGIEVAVLMISKGEPKENRAKVKEHGLTFPVVLLQQWEISRRYGMFATPIAYLINEQGVIAADVAVGVEPILALLIDANGRARERQPALR